MVPTNRLPLARAREDFAAVVNEVAFGSKRVILSRRGQDVVAIVSMRDLVALRAIESGAKESRGERSKAAKLAARAEGLYRGLGGKGSIVDELLEERKAEARRESCE